jgi:hypothetical protein
VSENIADSAERQDGGQAFPAAETHPAWDYPVHHSGMSMRDWFASQCDVAAYRPGDAFFAARGYWPTIAELAEYIANIRYGEADAMLAERAK